MIAGTPAEVVLPLTRAEAHALLSLARKGRVLLDVDKTFLRAPEQRAAGRRALSRLRLHIETTTPCRVEKAQPSDHGGQQGLPA